MMVGMFLFTDTRTTETYTLSLHDALPICLRQLVGQRPAEQLERGMEVTFDEPGMHRSTVGVDHPGGGVARGERRVVADRDEDRKSTRLNSSHVEISYAVLGLKKKTQRQYK